MRKFFYLLIAATTLAACSNDDATTKTNEHSHIGTHYENEQLSLQQNTGQNELTFPSTLQPTTQDGDNVTYELTAQQGNMSFFEGSTTTTYGYNGDFLGPVLRLKTGQHVTIKLTNALSEPTTFHWHGLEVAGDATDGGPHEEIAPGETKIISFTVNQQAATLWYHPHPMGNTASQVYKGLAGLMYIDDAKSTSLQLPNDYAINDFPLILQDRTFIDNGLQYDKVANTMGTLGDTVMINGVVNPKMTVERKKIRLRILNGSNALAYNLHFDENLPFELIATDGGYVNEATQMTDLTLGAGERAEILVDLSQTNAKTISLMNDETVLLPIDIQGTAQASATTTTLNDYGIMDDIATMEPTKHITLEGMTSKFLINGQTFDADRIDFTQKQGVTEIWEIENIITDEGAMAHPFHIHGTQFLVVSVDGSAPPASMQGYKDTITIQPNQKVRIAVSFSEKGIYMFHCHILEHEDTGMMGQIEVN